MDKGIERARIFRDLGRRRHHVSFEGNLLQHGPDLEVHTSGGEAGFMYSRRRLLILAMLGAATDALSRAANAQDKTPVVGLLWNDSVKPSPLVAILLDALREKGWIAGRNFRVEDRVTLEGYGGYVESAADLVRAKVDLIVTRGSTATFAAAKATRQIPIVMHMGSDPVGTGLVASLSRPGGNLTGVVTLTTGLNGKRIELLKELNPRLSSVGVLLTPNIANPVNLRESEAAARALGLQVHFSEARGPEDVDAAIAEFAKARVGGLYVAGSSMLESHSSRVQAAIMERRIPAVYANGAYVEAGGLMIYAPRLGKSFARLASYIDRILKGARPGELAIEQTSDIELTVNLKSAKALGVKIPQSILVRADRVIE
jgi:putative tryptophan/tyrosine transport system substrate-binding protein